MSPDQPTAAQSALQRHRSFTNGRGTVESSALRPPRLRLALGLSLILVAAVAGGAYMFDKRSGPSSPEEAVEMYLSAFSDGDIRNAWSLSCLSRKYEYQGDARSKFMLEATPPRWNTPEHANVEFHIGDAIPVRGTPPLWKVPFAATHSDEHSEGVATVTRDGRGYIVC